MLSSSHVKQLLLCFPPSREGSNFSNLGIKLPLPLRCPSPSSLPVPAGCIAVGGRRRKGRYRVRKGHTLHSITPCSGTPTAWQPCQQLAEQQGAKVGR